MTDMQAESIIGFLKAHKYRIHEFHHPNDSYPMVYVYDENDNAISGDAKEWLNDVLKAALNHWLSKELGNHWQDKDAPFSAETLRTWLGDKLSWEIAKAVDMYHFLNEPNQVLPMNIGKSE